MALIFNEMMMMMSALY